MFTGTIQDCTFCPRACQKYLSTGEILTGRTDASSGFIKCSLYYNLGEGGPGFLTLQRCQLSDVLQRRTSGDCDKNSVQDCSTLFYTQWTALTCMHRGPCNYSHRCCCLVKTPRGPVQKFQPWAYHVVSILKKISMPQPLLSTPHLGNCPRDTFIVTNNGKIYLLPPLSPLSFSLVQENWRNLKLPPVTFPLLRIVCCDLCLTIAYSPD